MTGNTDPTTEKQASSPAKFPKPNRGDYCRYIEGAKLGRSTPIKFAINGQKLLAIDYHRNGITGLPFHVAIIEEREGKEHRKMLVIRFLDGDKDTGQTVCAAFDIKKLAQEEIRFFFNSWRGDYYHELIDKYLAQRKTAQSTLPEASALAQSYKKIL